MPALTSLRIIQSRCMAYSSRQIDILGQIAEYPFLNRFLYAPDDPIKQQWAFVKEWSEQCQRNPKVTEKQFKILRQRYELTPLYLDPELTESNPFLKDIFTRIEDDEPYDKPNHKTLSDAQFDATKRVLHETLATKTFKDAIPDTLEKVKDDISSLNFKSVNFLKIEQQLGAWAKYKFLSYGHPEMVRLHQEMLQNGGTVPFDRIKDIVVYMKMTSNFKYENQEFNDALKWFSKMNWIIDHEFAKDVHQTEIKSYFQFLLNRYMRIKSLFEDDTLLERCRYLSSHDVDEQNAEMVEVTMDNVVLWLKQLAKKESDPLMEYLKEEFFINPKWDDNTLHSVRDAIVNRFHLDIGGLMEKHSRELFPLLHNAHLLAIDKSSQIKEHRRNVLRGRELNEKYLTELRSILEPLQQEFQLKAL